MELKDFICATLKEIIAGVREAQNFAAENEACINPNQFWRISTKAENIIDMGDGTVSIVQPVQFDVCVTESNKMAGEGGIKILSGNIENQSSTASRIKFSVAVSLPRMRPNYRSDDPDYGARKFEK